MTLGPQHPSIQAHVRRATLWTRVRMVLSVGLIAAMFWALYEKDAVTLWSQTMVRTTLSGVLKQPD